MNQNIIPMNSFSNSIAYIEIRNQFSIKIQKIIHQPSLCDSGRSVNETALQQHRFIFITENMTEKFV